MFLGNKKALHLLQGSYVLVMSLLVLLVAFIQYQARYKPLSVRYVLARLV